jgi:hypothetical protein
MTEGLGKYLSDFERRKLEGIDHWVLQRDPKRVAETVKQFMAAQTSK